MASWLIRAGSHGEVVHLRRFSQHLPRAAQQRRTTHCRRAPNGWKPAPLTAPIKATAPVTAETAEDSELEKLAHDRIAQLIASRFNRIAVEASLDSGRTGRRITLSPRQALTNAAGKHTPGQRKSHREGGFFFDLVGRRLTNKPLRTAQIKGFINSKKPATSKQGTQSQNDVFLTRRINSVASRERNRKP